MKTKLSMEGNYFSKVKLLHFRSFSLQIFLLCYLNANSSCLVIPMFFNGTEVDCDISRNVHVNYVFTTNTSSQPKLE